jgi:hypothetical protein
MLRRFMAPVLILVVLASVAVWGCSTMERTEKFYETYSAPAGIKVDVANASGGDVAITAWSIDYVEVSAVKKTIWGEGELDKVDIQVTTENDHILIETVVSGKNVRASVDYEIKMPNNAVAGTIETTNGRVALQGVSGDVVVTSSNGEISAQGLVGRITATTSNGRIELDTVSGGGVLTTTNGAIVVKKSGAAITASTTTGGIRIEDSKGDLLLNSSNGGITVSRVDGYVSAKTSNGAIDIAEVTGIVIAETSNNSIEAEIANVGPVGTTVKTANGSIEVSVSPALNANIEMKTTSGQISIISAPSSLQIETSTPTHFQGVLGSGGPDMYVEASNGSIDFYKLEALPASQS